MSTRALPRSLIPIYGITFVDILGFTILIPLLPYVAERFGASDAVAGTLITTSAVFATLSSPFWGALSDRFGRKSALLGSQACSFVGYLLIALAAGLPLLFISRSIEGLGGGNLGVAQSYITDETDEAQRPRAFAYAAAAFGAGFVVGPILGGSLARFGFAIPFFVAAGLQVLEIVLTLMLLPNSRQPARTQFRWKELGAAMRSGNMASLLWRQFLYIFAFTYLFTIFSLYLAKVLHVGPQGSSLLLGVAGAIGAATLLLGVAPLVRRFGERGVAVGGFAIGIVAYALLGLVGTVGAFAGVLVLWAISGSLLRPTLTAQISNRAPAAERGTVLGFTDSLNNFAMIFAPAIGGTVVEFSPRLSGVLPAVALMMGLVLAAADGEPEARPGKQWHGP